MKVYHFASKFRSLDVGGIQFRDYRFSTTDEAIAESLRGKRDVWEITDAVNPPSEPDAPPPPPEQVAAKEKVEADIETGVPKTMSGMRTQSSTKKEKKNK
jgi:hypothetical protein